MKSCTDPVYRLQADYTSYHNHPLPVQNEVTVPGSFNNKRAKNAADMPPEEKTA